MIRRAIPFLAASVLALFALPMAAQAQSVRLLGDFRDWSAYATSDSAGQICFIVSRPTDTEPVPDGYGEAYLYLTHRPAENIRNELNLVAGYDFMDDAEATLFIGSRSFALFTQGDAAWLDNVALSQDVAGYMRAGSSVVIEGTTARGIKVRQTFSLSGATAASRAIDAECR